MCLAPSIKERRPWSIMQEIDVSLECSSVCVVDGSGKIVRESKVASEPEALIGWFTSLGIGAGAGSGWKRGRCRNGFTRR